MEDTEALVQAFRDTLEFRRIRPHTAATYLHDLRRFLEDDDPRAITPDDARLRFRRLLDTHAAKTVRDTQLIVRRFYRFLVTTGRARHDPTREFPLIPYATPPQPAYTPDDVHRLVLASADVRTRALVLVLFDTGLRLSELLRMERVDWTTGRIVIASGKTPSAARTVRLGRNALAAAGLYAECWGVSSPPFWRGRRGRLTESGVVFSLKRLCRDAGIPYKGVHAFRRAAAAEMKRRGMNDSDILEYFGWTDVTMLRRYTESVKEELALAAHTRYSPSDGLLAG